MNRRDFLSTSSKVACACALGAGSLLITHCSGPSDSYVPADSSGIELDFDFIEDGAERGAPRYMEWFGAFALMVTLIWLYLEMLRLLAKIRSR